ncbi:hypothetical protein lerEdw1_004641 [Lerista edwardsae]|nr:hypothetical protein lerEdw1_004641 [Lerista edwardsae]
MAPLDDAGTASDGEEKSSSGLEEEPATALPWSFGAGIFIALLLRFDLSLKKNSHTYFYTSFLAYIFGLGLTIFIMHIFKHAQVFRVVAVVLCPSPLHPHSILG